MSTHAEPAAPPPPLAPPPARPAEAAAVEQIAVVLDRCSGSRLLAAERLAVWLPRLAGPALGGLEIRLSPSAAFTALLRLERPDPAARRRIAFWAARAGARALDPAALAADEREDLWAGYARSALAIRCEPFAVAAEARRFFTTAGAPGNRELPPPNPLLQLEVEGAEWDAVRWDPEGCQLFVPGPLAPEPDDALVVGLFIAGARNLSAEACVVSVRAGPEAAPGHVEGFTLRLVEPGSELLLVLDRYAEGGEASYAARRAHPRYALRAPADLAVGAPAAAAEPDHGTLENLSLGGAFVRSEDPLPCGTRVAMTSTLPTGDTVRVEGEVVFSSGRGMGVRFAPEAASDPELAGAVARVACRRRRALVVDDDGLSRRMLSDALEARGFEVVCADDGAAGLQVLSEELLSLDLLVCDLWMPGMDGEVLLRTVRQAGGEGDLAIVMISGQLEPGLEKKLQREGADAVLEKELGPTFLAQAAAAVLERKRSTNG